MRFFFIFLVWFSTGFSKEYFSERLHQGWQQTFEVSRWLVQKESPFQKIQLFENPLFGRVLVLDGIVQITEKDEFVYQEMLCHVPLFAHGRAKRVLVIGGGDGGILREILKHPEVEKAVLVEIDGEVIEVAKKYLPEICGGAFEDHRAQVLVADGIDFVKKTQETFDVIIIDTTDPVGPGKTLFSEDFLASCKKVLAPEGILTIQNGVFFLQKEELKETLQRLKAHFKQAAFYTAAVPTYVGGAMAFGFASDDEKSFRIEEKVLQKRLKKFGGSLKYYTPGIHKASFALPLWVESYLAENG
ncbi:MAG: polyamine aminopropyltransferase [Parachlamydiales bacterium]|jgi:spermidine synthase